MNKGWISIHRKIIGSPLWIQGGSTQKLLMIVLVMLAPTRSNKIIFDGKEIMICRGQLITSIDRLVDILGKGASIQKVRTALGNLKRYGFLTEKVTNEGRLINVVNYSIYQGPLRQLNKQTNKDLTTYNNKNKREKIINIKGGRKSAKEYSERDYSRDDWQRKQNNFFKKEM